MQPEYAFALACLGLTVFNGLRAWWAWRNGQRIMACISMGFFVLALCASAFMGYQGWRAEKKQQAESRQFEYPAKETKPQDAQPKEPRP